MHLKSIRIEFANVAPAIIYIPRHVSAKNMPQNKSLTAQSAKIQIGSVVGKHFYLNTLAEVGKGYDIFVKQQDQGRYKS